MDPILIFLGIAVGIVLLAVLLSRLFRKNIERDKHNAYLNDANGDGRDASDHATWIGIKNRIDGDGPLS